MMNKETNQQVDQIADVQENPFCTIEIGAYDVATIIRVMPVPMCKPADLSRPGHVSPLIGKPGGVLQRAGHTEAAIDLARLAGLSPAGVICEIMNTDGTMARVPE